MAGRSPRSLARGTVAVGPHLFAPASSDVRRRAHDGHPLPELLTRQDEHGRSLGRRNPRRAPSGGACERQGQSPGQRAGPVSAARPGARVAGVHGGSQRRHPGDVHHGPSAVHVSLRRVGHADGRQPFHQRGERPPRRRAAVGSELEAAHAQLIDVHRHGAPLWPSGLHAKRHALFSAMDSADGAPPGRGRGRFCRLAAADGRRGRSPGGGSRRPAGRRASHTGGGGGLRRPKCGVG